MRAGSQGARRFFSLMWRVVAILLAASIIAGAVYMFVPKLVPQSGRAEQFGVVQERFAMRSVPEGLSIWFGRICAIAVAAVVGRKVLKLHP